MGSGQSAVGSWQSSVFSWHKVLSFGGGKKRRAKGVILWGKNPACLARSHSEATPGINTFQT